MIEIYEKYLENIGKSLDKFFKEQSPYICCKKGCSSCCETGEYPFSELEFKYAMLGYNELSEEEKKIIQTKVDKIKNDKAVNTEGKFLYGCPFLINNICSIYKYRGLICRNHGLAYYSQKRDGEMKYILPHCVNDKLNYYSVYDEKTGTISSEKWEETGIEVEPVSHNVSWEFLTNNNTTKQLGIDFGDAKPLIDWL